MPQEERSVLKKVSLLVLILCCVLGFKSHLPDLGDPSRRVLSKSKERQLGASALMQIQDLFEFETDPVVNQYINILGQRLLAMRMNTEESFHFFVVRDPSINAFALPGGFIGIHTGLILAAQTESELAAVMAHEIAHVTQKHIARLYDHMGKVRLGSLVGLAGAVLLGAVSAEAASGALAATLASGTQSFINFTRENEKEADFVGIQLLANAGFDPNAMGAFFSRMAQAHRFDGDDFPDYLQTHPLTENRRLDALRRAKAYPFKQIPEPLNFHLIQSRLKVANYSRPQQAQLDFQSHLQSGTFHHKAAIQYALGIAMLQSGDFKPALEQFEDLLSQNPNPILYQLGWIEAQVSLGHAQKAIERCQSLLGIYPHHPLLTVKLAQIWFQERSFEQSAHLLSAYLLKVPHHVEPYALLARAYSQLNQPVKAVRYLAKYKYLMGDLHGARLQLKIGLKLESLGSRQKAQLTEQLQLVEAQLSAR